MRRTVSGDHRNRRLSTYEQFLILAFAQLTYRESLRDIANGLGALALASITLASAERRHAALWRMPTRSVIGASSPTSPRS